MVNFFKSKKYENLPPGERIEKLIREYLETQLVKIGFKSLKSTLTFNRKHDLFTQEIHITKSRNNYSNVNVDFWLILCVKANYYNKWHNTSYGFEPKNHYLFSSYDSHIPEWKSKYRPSTKYDLAKYDNHKLMKNVTENTLKIGVPLLELNSDWERAADYMVKREQFAYISRIFDFYIIADKIYKASECLILAEKCYSKYENVPKERFEEIKTRRDYLQHWL